jgi:hypothetical protein
MMTWTFRTGAACVALSVLALAGCGGSDHSPVERKIEFGTVGQIRTCASWLSLPLSWPSKTPLVATSPAR